MAVAMAMAMDSRFETTIRANMGCSERCVDRAHAVSRPFPSFPTPQPSNIVSSEIQPQPCGGVEAEGIDA